jgi:hypothetical protein
MVSDAAARWTRLGPLLRHVKLVALHLQIDRRTDDAGFMRINGMNEMNGLIM